MFRFKKDLKTGDISFVGVKDARSLNYLGEKYFYSKRKDNLTKEETLVYIESDYHHDIDEILEKQGYSFWERMSLKYRDLYDQMFNRDKEFLDNFDIYDKLSDFNPNWYEYIVDVEYCQNKIDGKYYMSKSKRKDEYADKFK